MSITATITSELSKYGTGRFVWNSQHFIVHYAYTDSSTLACPIVLNLDFSHELAHDTVIHVDAHPFDEVEGRAAHPIRLPSQISWDLGEGKYFDQKTGREYKGPYAGEPILLHRSTKDGPRKHQYNASSPVEVLESLDGPMIPASSAAHECGLRFNVLSEHCGKRPFLLRIRGTRASDGEPVFNTEAAGALVFVTSKPQSKKLDKSAKKCVLYSDIVKIAVETAKAAKDTPKKTPASKARAKPSGGSGRKSASPAPELPSAASISPKGEIPFADHSQCTAAAVPCIPSASMSCDMTVFPALAAGYGEVSRFHSLDPATESYCPDASCEMYPNDRSCGLDASYPPEAVIPSLLSQNSLVTSVPMSRGVLETAFSSLEIVDSVFAGQNPAQSGGSLMKDYSL